jgi:hypothetical protein
MMASGLAAAAAVTSFPVATVGGDIPPLSVKRVLGSLPGWKLDNLAVPYDNVVYPGREIDAHLVDYWKITLNLGDTVILALNPTGTHPSTDYVFRIWDSQEREILPANKQPLAGTELTFIAPGVDTYTIGISTSANPAYPYDPGATQPAASGPSPHQYTATFNAYPGPSTDLMDVLKHYDNVAWPDWQGDPDKQTALNTLNYIATQNSNVTGSPIINFSGSFEQVGKITASQSAGNLDYTWAPFATILSSQDEMGTAIAIYQHPADHDVLQNAYPTLDAWLNVARPFITDLPLQQAYSDVDNVLLDANQDRTNIDTFFGDLRSWQAAYQGIVGNEPIEIADLLKDGLVSTKMPAPVSNYGWLKTLIGSVTTIISGAASVATGSPAGGLVASILLGSITNPLDAYLDGYFDPQGKKPVVSDTSSEMVEAAVDMKATSNATFLGMFKLLVSPEFEATLFSNYGLLQAMRYVRFDPSPGGVPTPSKELLDDYDITVWQQLLPKMFQWELVPNLRSDSTVPDFTFFSPLSETATSWQNPQQLPPSSDGLPTTGKWSLTETQMTDDAKRELQLLQAGKPFDFWGHDFTPSGWFGPGPISVPRTLTGKSSSFYTITPNTHINENALYRHTPWSKAVANPPNPSGGFSGWVVAPGYWHSYATLEGETILEWTLVTRADDTKRIGKAAADTLFGTGSLDLASQDLIHYDKNDNSAYTYDFKVQSGGLVTRYDVFSHWGGGTTDFTPSSLEPPKFQDYMSVVFQPGDNRYGQYFDNLYAYATITYGKDDTGRPPGPPPPSGHGAALDRLVTTLYLEQLGRYPDRRGLRYWAGQLASGMSPARVAQAIWVSSEHKAILKGLQPPVPRISLARSLADAVQDGRMATRPAEWHVDAFIKTLYREQLGRDPERAGLLNWSRQFASGTTLAGMARAIWDSPEHKAILRSHPVPRIGLARSLADAVRAGSQPSGQAV